MANEVKTPIQNDFEKVLYENLPFYIFDISIPLCHHLYLSATLKQYFTEFAVT
jgi:hypothetical protein